MVTHEEEGLQILIFYVFVGFAWNAPNTQD